VHKFIFYFASACLWFLTSSCQHFTDEGAADACVDSFALHYFNWQYEACVPYVTADSKRWLEYAASQVHEEDVEALRAMTSAAKCEVVSLQYGENEQQMNAKVEVSNFLAMDTLGTVAHQVEKAVYAIALKQHDNRWLVDLNRLPQRVK
jgi:hypothetical protein